MRAAPRESALAAARETLAELAALPAPEGEAPLRLVIALHFGEVTYGNIGSSDRVDFTVIGPAVNLVSRIEAIAKARDLPLIVSDDFARAFGYCAELSSLGPFALRGLGKAARIVRAGPLADVAVAALILPVFAVIVTGWLAGLAGYVPRNLSDGLIHFAYNVAMPALLVVTIAQEPARALLAWRFLIAFGGGSLLCFAFVFATARALGHGGVAGPSMQGWAASMTNTGFVALPILQATYGPHAVLPAAIATVFVAVVMFPAAVILQELGRGGRARADDAGAPCRAEPDGAFDLRRRRLVGFRAGRCRGRSPPICTSSPTRSPPAPCSPSGSGCRSTGSRRMFGARRR